MDKERKEWLASLNVGDEVAISYSDHYDIARIERTTATLIIINGTKYRRDNGKQSPERNWYTPRLVPVSPEIRNARHRIALMNKIIIVTIIEEGGAQ